MNTCRERAQQLCTSNLNLVNTLYIMQEVSDFFRKGMMPSAAAKC